ncbi:MAG: ShlB/FhaC/HecB family hemolysin secretion/activation protein [Rhizomicrobium sp.]
MTHLAAAAPTQFGRFQYVAVSQSSPLDAGGTTALAGASYLRTRLGDVRGAATTLQLGISHDILRTLDETLTGSLGVDSFESSTTFTGFALATDRVRALRVGAAYSVRGTDAAAAVNAAAAFGIAGFGAKADDGLMGNPAFRKFALQAAYDRRVGEAFTLRLRGMAQYAAGRLPAEEFYTFGGTIGSAFATGAIFGDDAAGGRAELAWRPPLPDCEPYAFLDGGGAWLKARHALTLRSFDFASAGGGVRFVLGGHAALEMEGASGLAAEGPGLRTGTWRLSFALRIAAD